MKINRSIGIYKKEEDKLFKEVEINDINITILNSIFIQKENDPNFYAVYAISEAQYLALIKYKKELESYEYTLFDMYMETYTV
jgi:hypothetical protein